jgi:hypothetical protein
MFCSELRKLAAGSGFARFNIITLRGLKLNGQSRRGKQSTAGNLRTPATRFWASTACENAIETDAAPPLQPGQPVPAASSHTSAPA